MVDMMAEEMPNYPSEIVVPLAFRNCRAAESRNTSAGFCPGNLPGPPFALRPIAILAVWPAECHPDDGQRRSRRAVRICDETAVRRCIHRLPSHRCRAQSVGNYRG